MAREMPKKLAEAGMLYLDILEELEQSGVLTISSEEYEILTTPLKKAARKANLKIGRGKIYTKNNRNCCDVLLFPLEFEYAPLDIPIPKHYIWETVICAKADFISKSKRRLEQVVTIYNSSHKVNIWNEYIKRFRTDKLPPLSESDFFDFQNGYGEILEEIGVGHSNQFYLCSGWSYYGEPRYFLPEDLSYNRPSPFKDYEKAKIIFDKNKAAPYMEPVCSPFECVFMAITLFSICKSLFLRYRIKANFNFCVHISIKSTNKEDDMIKRMLLNRFADMWCNYRSWDHRKEAGETGQKFWNVNDKNKAIYASWSHFNFPLVLSDYPRIGWDDCDDDYNRISELLPNKEVHSIAEARCVPILYTFSFPEKAYSAQDCLKLVWETQNEKNCLCDMRKKFEPTCDKKKNLWYRHNEITQFYVTFLNALNDFLRTEGGSAMAKKLRTDYKDALFDLGALPPKATLEQQQKACLLSAMYVARDLLRSSRYLKSIERMTRNLKAYLGREVMLIDFAKFVRECFKENSKYGKVLCFQDKDGIYLNYTTYWDEFKRYCVQENIMVNCGAAAFRRNVLEQYISPQYDPSDSRKYPRYDYRKKVGNKTVTVLKVLPKILKIK